MGRWQLILAGASTAIVGALGGWDKPLQALLFFVVADYLAGLLVALTTRQFSSEVGFKGFIRKVGYFAAIAGAHAFDQYLTDGSAPWARTAVTLLFAVNEAGSFFSNLAALGVPIPKFLTTALQREIDRKRGSSRGMRHEPEHVNLSALGRVAPDPGRNDQAGA